VTWLYTQKLPEAEEDWAGSNWNEISDPVEALFLEADLVMLKVYVFADKYLVPDLRRATCKVFVDCDNMGCMSSQDRYQLAKYSFSNIPANRPILQYIVDEHCSVWREWADGVDEEKTFQELTPGHSYIGS